MDCPAMMTRDASGKCIHTGSRWRVRCAITPKADTKPLTLTPPHPPTHAPPDLLQPCTTRVFYFYRMSLALRDEIGHLPFSERSGKPSDGCCSPFSRVGTGRAEEIPYGTRTERWRTLSARRKFAQPRQGSHSLEQDSHEDSIPVDSDEENDGVSAAALPQAKRSCRRQDTLVRDARQ